MGLLPPALRLGEHALVRAARPDRRGGRVAAVLLADGAGFGRLWLATAAALAAAGERPRRAAVRGCAGWAAAELAASAVKQVVDRRRPRLPTLGAGVRTSSFPSAHAAAAAGFAAAATVGHPPVLAVVGPLAAGVCWSRVATGRHFATDVAAGVVLGAAAGVGASRIVDAAGRRLATEPPGPM